MTPKNSYWSIGEPYLEQEKFVSSSKCHLYRRSALIRAETVLIYTVILYCRGGDFTVDQKIFVCFIFVLFNFITEHANKN